LLLPDRQRARIRHPTAITGNASRAWTGQRRERPRAPSQALHPTAIVVGTESPAAPSDGVAGSASDRRRVHQRQEGTHADAIPGTALRRHQIWQVSAALRRGAAQPAHPADAVPATEIVAIFRGIMEMTAVPIYRGGAADAPSVGRARANHGMSGQRMIQPRDCCGLTANGCESGIRPPSQGTHALPG
jgi:hypothetical protein